MLLPLTNAPRFRYTLSMPSGLLPRQQLRYEPADWAGMGVKLTRDFGKRHGCTTEYTATLSFVKDGRAYLRRAYEAAGPAADVRVLIEQLDPNSLQWLPYFSGRVNFTTAEFTATAAKVTLEQQGWLQKFLSRDSVQVDLLAGTSVGGSAGPIPTATTVQLHSRAILQRYAASQKSAVTTTGQMTGDEGDASHEQLLYFGFDTAETNELGLGAVTGGWVIGDPYAAVPIFTTPGDGEYTIDLALYADIFASNEGKGPYFEQVDGVVHFRINGDPRTATALQPDVRQRANGEYRGVIDVPPRTFTVQLAKGDNIYLYADYFLHEIGGLGTTIRYRAHIDCTLKPGSYLRIAAVTTTAATPATGLLVYEALERLCQALTDEVDVFRSDYFGRTDRGYAVDGPGALTLLTGGFQVRGFPLLTDPAPAARALDPRKSLTASWQTVYDALAADYGLGWGLEWVVNAAGQLVQVIRVEPLSYWYASEVVLDLTGAGILADTVKVNAPALYQTVEMNYAKWQSESANGLDEFNSTRQWTTPLDVVDTAYQPSSQLIASGTLLEATRRNRYDATATTDTSSDDTLFLVCLLRLAAGGYETERNQRCQQLSGVLSPATVYNLRLSPARRLLRHAQAFAAGTLPTAGARLRFTAGEGNVSLVSQLDYEPAPVAENGTLAFADLPRPLWRPEQVSLGKVPVTRQQLGPVLARPRGRVRYRSLAAQGQVREGWLLDFSHAAAEEQADLTLLPCFV